jgi:hypothetical protein
MRLSKSVLRSSAMAVIALGVTLSAIAQETNTALSADAVPPPSGPPKRSGAELEKLVAPIALYPDSLIATLLPASVYPLEIVQAAQFIADTNNIPKVDEQPWDDNVKALARIPEALKKLSDNLQWTIQLGDAFLAQDKDVMDAIQALRLKAEKAGTLRTTEQQIVTVTNTIVETTVQQQVVIVTNTIVQIVPSNPEVIYVPTYNPTVVYYPPPTYVYNPYDPWITFGAGVAAGVIIANNSCDWYHGGCYHGHYDYHHNTKIKVEGDVNIGSGNIGSGNRGNRPTPYSDRGQKWQPDQSRLNRSGSAGTTSVRSQEARGWGAGTRPSTGAVGARPSTGTAGARPSTGAVGARPSASTGASGNRPSAGAGPQVVRGSPSTTPSVNRPSTTTAGARPSQPPSGVSRSPSTTSRGSYNAFGGVGSGSTTRQFSSRGSASRGGGGFSRGAGGGRGGGRR